MSKVKNVSGGPRYVPLLDREVADGEVIEVPDYQPAHNPGSSPGDPDHLPVAWPEATWEPVPDMATRTTRTTNDADGKAEG